LAEAAVPSDSVFWHRVQIYSLTHSHLIEVPVDSAFWSVLFTFVAVLFAGANEKVSECKQIVHQYSCYPQKNGRGSGCCRYCKNFFTSSLITMQNFVAVSFVRM